MDFKEGGDGCKLGADETAVATNNDSRASREGGKRKEKEIGIHSTSRVVPSNFSY